MNSKSNSPDAAVQERRAESRNRQQRMPLGLPAEQVSHEDTLLTQSSYERANPLQNSLASHPSGSVAIRLLPALMTSAQGFLAIGFILTLL